MDLYEWGIPDSLYDALICTLHDFTNDKKKDRYDRLHKVIKIGLRKSPNAQFALHPSSLGIASIYASSIQACSQGSKKPDLDSKRSLSASDMYPAHVTLY